MERVIIKYLLVLVWYNFFFFRTKTNTCEVKISLKSGIALEYGRRPSCCGEQKYKIVFNSKMIRGTNFFFFFFSFALFIFEGVFVKSLMPSK